MQNIKYIILITLCYSIVSCSLWDKITKNDTHSKNKQPSPPSLALADQLKPQLIDSAFLILDDTSDLYDFSTEMVQIDIDSLYTLFETIPDDNLPIFTPDEVEGQIQAMQGKIKIQYNNYIQKEIDKLTSKYGRKYLSKVLAVSQLYFPIIEKIFKEEGIPDEMKYASIIESGLIPNIMSHAGAVGFWQFMYYTGKRTGLEINSIVDNRCNITASTKAAAKYMKELYAIYGDWLLVLAAYNSGPGNVNKALRKNDNVHNFWHIQKNLPRETRKHIPRFIAVYYAFHYHTSLMIAPQRNLIKFDAIDAVTINQPIHLGQVANSIGMKEKDLALLNRHFLKGYIPAKAHKSYMMYIPNNKMAKYIEQEEDIFAYQRNLFYSSTGKHIAKKKSFYPIYGIPGNGKRITYRVRSGDYLGRIAQRFGVSVKKIKAWNGLRSNNIRVGQRLHLYSAKRSARNYSVKRKVSKPNVKLPYQPSKYIYHTIQKNENCWSIAKKYKGVSQKQILTLNKISNPQQLRVGQKIRIKKKS